MSVRREFGGVRWSPHGMVHVDPSGGRSRNRVADGKKSGALYIGRNQLKRSSSLLCTVGEDEGGD